MKRLIVALSLAAMSVVTAFAMGDASVASGEFPCVVKVFPANGDTNVNPKTSKIVITFDRPMDGGCSFARGIGSNWNHFPETTGKPTWNKKMTQITFPVKLRSGWEYVASINREGADNFRSVNGKPVQGVRYAFRTSGKTEPLVNVPHIVKIEPANGAKNVSVSLKAIRVTFDRKMQDGCFSVCRSNGGTWEDFPKVTSKLFYDESCTVLTIPVSLVPGKTYKLQFNNGEACSLMDTEGHSLEDYPYSFTTEEGAKAIESLQAKADAGDYASAWKNYASEAIPVLGNLRTKIGVYAYDKGCLPNNWSTDATKRSVQTWIASANGAYVPATYKLGQTDARLLQAKTTEDLVWNQVDIDYHDLKGFRTWPSQYHYYAISATKNPSYAIACFGDGKGAINTKGRGGYPVGTGYAVCEICYPKKKYQGTWKRYLPEERQKDALRFVPIGSGDSASGKTSGCLIPSAEDFAKDVAESIEGEPALIKKMKAAGWEF